MDKLAGVIENVKQSDLVKDLGKGGDQATSIYKIAKKSKKEAKDWRIKLSGVLSEQQIVFSLMVIGLFYFCYATSNYYFRHKMDEDFVTRIVIARIDIDIFTEVCIGYILWCGLLSTVSHFMMK